MEVKHLVLEYLKSRENKINKALPKFNELNNIWSKVDDYLRSVFNLPLTIHDSRHSLAVEALCFESVPHFILNSLNISELYILILGLWLHDGGLVPEYEGQTFGSLRKNHHIRIAEKIRQKKLSFIKTIDQRILECVAVICQNHCENSPKCVDKTRLIDTDIINLQLLSSIIRLCDICHVTTDRIPIVIYENYKFGSESIDHWKKHKIIEGFKPFHISQEETKFVLEARYLSEKDKRLIFDTIEYIEIEFKKIEPILKEYKWNFHTKIDTDKVREKKPEESEDGWNVTVLPTNIYNLLFEKLYESQDVFIRELIQNAIDSCKTNIKLAEQKKIDYDPVIQITLFYKKLNNEKIPYILKIFDNGIGMNQSDVKEYLLNIGNSVSKNPEIIKLLNSGTNPEELIAEFGIGIFTCLPVADKLYFVTKKNDFYGLKVEFPSLNKEYTAMSEESVQVSTEDVSFTGTIGIIYLNDIGNKIPIYETIEKYCRNSRFKICYSELEYTDDNILCQSHEHNSHCKYLEKKNITAQLNTEQKIALNYWNEKGLEGIIGLVINKKDNHLIICQEGILIQDCKELIPEGLFGVIGEINLKSKVVDLTASRSQIKTNSKYVRLKKNIEEYFNELIKKMIYSGTLDNITFYGGGYVNNLIYYLNYCYYKFNNNLKELKSFYRYFEEVIKVSYGILDETKSLKDIKILCKKNKEKLIYHIISQQYYYSHIPMTEINGYDVVLLPRLSSYKAELLSNKGYIVFKTIHGHEVTTLEKEHIDSRFIKSELFNSYFELNNIKVIQSTVDDTQTIVSKSENIDNDLKNEIQGIYNNNELFCFSSNIDLRCVLQSRYKKYINISHHSIKKILNKYLRDINKVKDEDKRLLKIYIALLALDLPQCIKDLEELLLIKFAKNEKKRTKA